MLKIVERPVLTEKSLDLAGRGWYTFAVPLHARKEQIAKEIAGLYKVTVTSIRTQKQHGKMRRAGKKMLKVKKVDWKKAIVKLAKGQTIEAFTVTGEANPAQK